MSAAAADAPRPARSRGISWRTLVLLAALFALIVFLVVGVVLRSLDGGDDSPAGIVDGYLTALAEGDAEAAMRALSSVPASTVLLTDEVLTRSNALAPIGDIVVAEQPGERQGTHTTVLASYTIGSTPVTKKISVVNEGGDDEVWRIQDELGQLRIPGFADLGLAINGQALAADELDFDGLDDRIGVFPGTYELTIDSETFALGGDSTISVGPREFALVHDELWDFPVTVTLSQTGLQEFRDIATAAVSACISSPNIQAGCGSDFDIPAVLSDGAVVVEGSVTRQTGDRAQRWIKTGVPDIAPVGRGTILVGPSGRWQGDTGSTFVRLTLFDRVPTSATCIKEGVRGPCDLSADVSPTLRVLWVDMSAQPRVAYWEEWE